MNPLNSESKSDFGLVSQIVTDFVFLCPAQQSARSAVSLGGAVWMYVFDHSPSDPSIWAGLTFCFNHACHGAELPFLFDSAPITNFTLTAQETQLANRMVCYWGAFAHSGDPNSRSQQTPFCRQKRLPAWPRYTSTENWPVLNLTLQSHPQHGNRDHFCDFWDELDIYWERRMANCFYKIAKIHIIAKYVLIWSINHVHGTIYFLML